jgi:predicted GH43/DUF377 family glycosyl hydrolase
METYSSDLDEVNGAQFTPERCGVLMEPAKDVYAEALGVLNPALIRNGDELLLFPRVVAEGNISRIEKVRVADSGGFPYSVERLGFALEPTERYERNERGTVAGVEDPRITYLVDLDCFVMAYVALGESGPRAALALSDDGQTWDRAGLLEFGGQFEAFQYLGNKDVCFFPTAVNSPDGAQSLAFLFRPSLDLTSVDTNALALPEELRRERPSIWIGYIDLMRARRNPGGAFVCTECRLLAKPQEPWEELKLGAGTPPILTSRGWVHYFHGVSGQETPRKQVRYSAGVLVLDRNDPTRVLFRSSEPILSPTSEEETAGTVDDVVFPTAVDVRGSEVDIYYGAADFRVAVARARFTDSILVAPGEACTRPIERSA